MTKATRALATTVSSGLGSADVKNKKENVAHIAARKGRSPNVATQLLFATAPAGSQSQSSYQGSPGWSAARFLARARRRSPRAP